MGIQFNKSPTTEEPLEYQDYTRSLVIKVVIAVVLAILVFISIGVSVTVSGYDITFAETYEIIYNHITHKELTIDERIGDYIVWEMNMPRAIFAVVAGFGLAVGGAAMQNVMKNPLADPYTTGISSGACLGMSIAMILGLSITGYGSTGVIINTFIFALVPMIFIAFVLPNRTTSVATLILIGISITYFFNAFTTLLMVSTDAETLAQIYSWQVGSIANITWDSIPIMAVVTFAGSVVLCLLARQMNILALGDDEAKSLGVNVDLYRTVILLILSLIVAVVVSYAGIIGFVGLVAPHIVRMLTGANNKYLIPIAGLLGAAILIFADIACRAINDAYLPVGIMASMLGAPIFIYIVVKSKVI